MINDGKHILSIVRRYTFQTSRPCGKASFQHPYLAFFNGLTNFGVQICFYGAA